MVEVRTSEAFGKAQPARSWRQWSRILDSWIEEIEFERLSLLAKVAKKLVVNPLANRLPVSWWKDWLGEGSSDLAQANWDNPGGWRSMVISYKGKPEKLWDRLLINGGAIPMALRNRRKLAGRLIAGLIDNSDQEPVHVLCLGAGPGMITADALAMAKRSADATLVDISSDAFEFGRQHAAEMNLRDRMTFIEGDVRDVAPQIDKRVSIVKTIGIFEYISDEEIVNIAQALRRVMPVGSTIVFNSISLRHGTDPFFRRVFGLHMNHRSPEQIQGLLAPAGFERFEVFPEPLGVYSVVVGHMGRKSLHTDPAGQVSQIAMPDISVPWGDEEMDISIPADWKLLPPAEVNAQAAPADWRERIAGALAAPLAGASLSERLGALGKGRVCLVVEDLTRHSPLADILEVVMAEIRRANIPDSQVDIVMAGGMHPHISDAEARDKLGPAVDDIPWRMNPWDDRAKYVEVGQVGAVRAMIDRDVIAADLRILISSVSPHLQAGFGGGYKMFFPGCGELASIRGLHRTGIRRRGQGQLVGVHANSMRAVIDRVGMLIDARHGETFSLQYLLDGDDLPVCPTAGEPLAVHRRLARTCGEVCGFDQQDQADILIANAHPRDHDLWQCFKCIPNTCWAARPGGVVICLARCPSGLNEMKSMSWPLSPAATRRLVRAIGPATISSIMDPLVRRLAGDSQWFLLLATQILARNHLLMVSPKLVADGLQFPGIGLYATVDQALAEAGRLLGGGPQRVTVCPDGGASFPRTHG